MGRVLTQTSRGGGNMRGKLTFSISFSICLAFVFFGGSAYAEDGVTEDTILIGTVGNLKKSITFPEETLGVKLYFKHVNDLGGIHGRQLKLIEYDDETKKELREKYILRLIENDKVFAIHVTGGTPTALMTMKYAMERKVLFTFPHQGSDRLAGKRYVFTSYPFYNKENDIMMTYLVQKRKFTRIGLVYADNAYGRIFLDGVKRNCKKYGIEITGAEPIKSRDPEDVSGLMAALKAEKTQALILALYVKQAAAILKERKKMGWDKATLVTTGPLTDEKFLSAGGGLGEGVIGMSLYPDPVRSTNPAIVEFRKILEKYYPGHKPDRYNFYGYLYTKLFVEGIKRAGKDLTREGFIMSMESIKNWESGVIPPVRFSETDHHAQHEGFIVELRNGVFKALTDWIRVD
jgi:ABC-type branched-subunit amino acid transport system substrate-binding protein